MKSLINERVNHNKYGEGVIVDENLKRIKVQFDQLEEQKEFLYPNSFEQYLSLQDEELQKECYEMAVDLRREQERLEMEKREAVRILEAKLRAEQKEQKKKTVSRRKLTKAVSTKK